MNDKITFFIKSNTDILEEIIKEEKEFVKEKMVNERDDEKRKEIWSVANYLSAKLADLKNLKIKKTEMEKDTGI